METWSSYIDGVGREGCAADPAALLRPGLELELIRQPADMGRPFSVAVHRRGVLIGYLPKPDARPVAKLIDRGGRARAFVLELRQERRFTGARLKSIVIEIEASNPGGEPWSDADRSEIVGLGVEPPLAARRNSYALPGRIAGVLCAGVVAVTAWAGIAELAPDLADADTPEPATAYAVAALPAEPAPAVPAVPSAPAVERIAVVSPAAKAQERPSSAPERVATTVEAGEPAANMPLLPQAALTLPSDLAPFEVAAGANHVTVPVRNAASLAVASALPASALAAPAAAVPPVAPALAAPVIQAAAVAPLPPEAPEMSVPLPVPRPDIPTKKRRAKRR